jgi:uncharacterized membrane protein
MSVVEFFELATRIFEVSGVSAMVLGFVLALALAARTWRRAGDGSRAFKTLRNALGGAILLGLELLVAADIIRTVAVSPTFTSAGVLATIVVIRTFLSFTLELELSGRWPWQGRPND